MKFSGMCQLSECGSQQAFDRDLLAATAERPVVGGKDVPRNT
jgi:hypothetical protein